MTRQIIAKTTLALLCASLPHAAIALEKLEQFTSSGHVLGFESGGYYVSNGAYALRVSFEKAAAVAPSADNAAGAESAENKAAPLGRVAYPDLWPGISVTYDAPGSGIARSTWTLAPGADPAAIRLRYNRAVKLTEAGELGIAFETGAMSESRPVAWQEVDGVRVPVDVTFAQLEDDAVGFRVGAYRSDLPLTIDPTLTWNTFLGGSGVDWGYAIAVDGSGNVYVAGYSNATWGSPIRAHTSDYDAFAAKLTSAGALTWNTFLGGSGFDGGRGIGVDGSGNVYVAGRSGATWGSPERAYTASDDAFAAKLTSTGALTWNTFLGGSATDYGYAVAVDGSENVYVAGRSDATWGSPVRAYTLSDAFAAKLTSTGALSWNTFLGGSGGEEGYAIAVDGSSDVYVAGYSGGSWGSPVRAYTNSFDAFIAQMPVDFAPTQTPTTTPTQTPTTTPTPPCGDTNIDTGVGEQCDDGNTLNGDCCSATCQYEMAGSPCPSDGEVCTDDVCDGSGTCGVANTASCDDGQFCNGTDTCAGGMCGHSGNPCTGGGECNNVCNEGAGNCFTTGGTACSTDNNPCTLDQCTGAGACSHPAGNAGTVCRGIAGPCDLAEQCDGSSATCPTDAFATSGTCRAIAGECDLAESCNGSGAQCPADIFKATGTACTSDGNACTPDECSGSSAACVHGDAAADSIGDLCDNCPNAANADQVNSDCTDASYFLTVGCAAPPANKAGCCDGGDVCDACPAQKDNADCDPDGSAGASIGPAGGTISTPDGAVTVSIPPGALPANTSITVTENGPATRFLLSSGAVFSASMRPENLQFLLPATITFTWADREGDGLVDRGTCVGGADDGLSCDHDADCTLNDCTANTNTAETSLVLKRNSSRFSKGGFGSPPYSCADHLSGACSTATANCSHAPGTGQATVANCCTPGANTWTFQTCSFSEIFLGLTAGDLVPGAGKASTDCAAEWAIRNAQNVPFADRKGLVNVKQTCTDGDPTCDVDGSADGDCVFEVAVCLNLSDPRLLDRDGNVACAPSSIDAWQAVKPRPDSTKPIDAANALALRSAVAALGTNTLSGDHLEQLTFTPALTAGDLCTAPVQISVVRRAADKSGKATLKMRALTGEVKDTDALKLTCVPPG